MAEEKQITDLESGTITNDNDVFVMDTYNGITVKIPYSVLRTAIANSITPSIASDTKHWLIGSIDTGIVAEGQNGNDGITPHIDPATKHWVIDTLDTGIVAEGQDGAQGQQGVQGDAGYSISVTVSQISGGHRITIHSTDPSETDTTFDVMDGNAGGYIQGNGILISGSEIALNIGSGLDIDPATGAVYVSKSSDIIVSQLLTLTAEGWDSTTNQQSVAFAHSTLRRNIIDITATELPDWAENGVYAVSETSSDITFKCATIPSVALTFRITCMEVEYDS